MFENLFDESKEWKNLYCPQISAWKPMPKSTSRCRILDIQNYLDSCTRSVRRKKIFAEVKHLKQVCKNFGGTTQQKMLTNTLYMPCWQVLFLS